MRSRTYVIASLALLSIAIGTSQTVISTNPAGTITVTQAAAALANAPGPVKIPIPQENIVLTRVVYTTRGIDGSRQEVSGLIAMPASGAPKGVVIYYHGTTADRNYVPSRFQVSTMQPAEVASASAAFAGGGYAVLMPDYLGLGVNQTVHPYPLASVNWRAGVDMLPAVTQISTDNRLPLGSQLYVSGYSEGGAVAMWAAMELDRQSPRGFRYVSAAPLSGPYDLTGAQMPFMTREIKNLETLGATVYFLSYVGYSGYANQGFNLSDYFVPSFASYIPVVFGRSLSDEAYARELMVKAAELGAFTSIERLMQPPFFRAMQEGAVDNPFSKLMQQNNCFDWTPQRPLFLFCIENDTMVDPQNTYHAIRAMRARGVTDQTMGFHIGSSNLKLNHATAQPSAVALARQFFDVGLARVPTTELPASAKPAEGSKPSALLLR
ncbi:MAG: hypothetical protein ACK4P3_02325 [Fimbriimonadaceae bacterium]